LYYEHDLLIVVPRGNTNFHTLITKLQNVAQHSQLTRLIVTGRVIVLLLGQAFGPMENENS